MTAETPSGPIAVVFVAAQFYPMQGGSEAATLREAKALRARGHDIRVLALRWMARWPRGEALEGVPVRRVGGVFIRSRLRVRFGAKWPTEALVWFRLMCTRRTYDVIHLRHLGIMTRPALLAALMTGKPLVARIAGCGPNVPLDPGLPLRLYAGDLDPSSPFLMSQDMPRNGDVEDLRRSQWFAGLTLRLLRHRRVTFAVTTSRIRTDLIRRGMRPEQIVVSATGIDPDAYRETARAVRARAAEGADPIVACPAHYRHEKGLDVLLHAWRRVHAQVPAARLVLAGHGPLEPQLRELAVALGIRGCVQFAGLVPDVRSVLATADIFVLPSRHEGLSNALLEAMASSLPCVATRVSGSEDVIVDGVCGLLVPPEDPDALASALLTLITDREYARAIGEAGLERVAQSYDQASAIHRLEQLYAAVTIRPAAQRSADHAAVPPLLSGNGTGAHGRHGDVRTYGQQPAGRPATDDRR